jgi:K+ transporter
LAIPKICTNKFFLLAVSASFAFSMFTYNVLNQEITEVKADNNENIKRIIDVVDKNSEKITEIRENVSYIKAKVEKIK